MAYSIGMTETNKPIRLASRITQVCRDTIDAIMKRRGITEAAVIEQAVRDYADKLNIPYADTDLRAVRPSPTTDQDKP